MKNVWNILFDTHYEYVPSIFVPINWQDRDFLPMPFKRVRTGIGQFWKVIEIDNAFFQDLESFATGRFFKLAIEKLWIFFLENSRIY